MEHFPSATPAQEKSPISFEKQVVLAENMIKAVEKRENFVRGEGGFDTFAEVGQHVEGGREIYDRLNSEAHTAIEAFDAQVSDRQKFVGLLRSSGKEALAEQFGATFNIARNYQEDRRRDTE